MAQTTEPYDGNGTRGSAGNALSFTFPYLKLTDVKVSLNGTTLATTKYTFPTATTLQFNTGSETTLQETSGAPKTGVSILIYRDTDVDSARHVFGQGSAIKSKDLNENKEQSLYFDQEVGDTANPKNFVTSAQISDGTSLSAADKTKLDAIEANAKDDQTGAEIKTLYEAESNTNAFTDAEKTKLGTVEANAKDDQTAAEIKSLYESNSQTNAFTDAEKTKLQGVEDNAKDDQTATEIKSLYESNSDTNAFTDADHTKLDGIEANAINASNAAITNKLPLTGGLMTGDLILSSSVPKLRFVDTDGTASYRLINNSGAFKIQDTSDSNATRFSIFSTGNVNVDKNLTVNENLTVQGNIIVNGTSTTLNTATVNVDDKNFVLMSIDSPTDALAHNGGFTLRGDTDKTFQWKSGTDSWTSSEHIHLIDTKRLYLGDSRDLEIYHNGTQSVINNQLGNFLIQQAASTSFLFLESDTRIVLNGLNDATNPMAKFIKDGAVELYYDGSKKLETTSTGTQISCGSDGDGLKLEGTTNRIDIVANSNRVGAANTILELDAHWNNTSVAFIALGTGDDTTNKDDGRLRFFTKPSGGTITERLKIEPNGSVQIPNDSAKLQLGASQDLALYHQHTTSSYGGLSVIESHTMPLAFKTNRNGNTEDGMVIYPNNRVELFYDNSKKLETTSTGVRVNGQLTTVSNVGIGTTSPNINNGYNTLTLNASSNGGVLAFCINDVRKGLIYTESDGDLKFQSESGQQMLFASGGSTNRLQITSTGQVRIPNDGQELAFGGSQDLKIYHSGQQSFIDEVGVGSLYIRNGTDNSVVCNTNAAVELYYDGSKKLETTSTGATVTGSLVATSNIQANGAFKLGNGNYMIFGASNGMFMFHTGTTGFIDNNVGTLKILSDSIKLRNNAEDHDYIVCNNQTSVDLYYDNSKKFETTSTGVNVGTGGDLTTHIGNCNRLAILGDSTNRPLLHIRGGSPGIFFDQSGGNTSKIYQDFVDLSFYVGTPANYGTEALVIKSTGDIQIPNDNKKLQIGASQDLELYHDASSSIINNNTNILRVRSNHLLLSQTNNSRYLQGNSGVVELFYDNAVKLTTTSTGATVTTTSAANSIKNITTSTSGPSGGSDGDLWFTYVA